MLTSTTKRYTENESFNFLFSLQQISLEGVAENLKNINLLVESYYAALDLNQIKVLQSSRGIEYLSKGFEDKFLPYYAHAIENFF